MHILNETKAGLIHDAVFAAGQTLGDARRYEGYENWNTCMCGKPVVRSADGLWSCVTQVTEKTG